VSRQSATPRAQLAGRFETIRKSEPHSNEIAQDWKDSGQTAIKFSLELSAGCATITEAYKSGPIVGFDETYSVFKDVVRFGDTNGEPFTARWKLDGNRLRFTDVSSGGGDEFVWGRTWVRTR
jgi:hypothetical protein